MKLTTIAEGDISRIAAAVAKNYPDVTPEQLKASVREAARGGKSDSEIAQALRGKYKAADFEGLLAGVREAALKGAEHDQLLKAIRQECAHISPTRAEVIAKTETNRAFTIGQCEADRQFLDQNGWTGKAYKPWGHAQLQSVSLLPSEGCCAAGAFLIGVVSLGDVVTAVVELEDG